MRAILPVEGNSMSQVEKGNSSSDIDTNPVASASHVANIGPLQPDNEINDGSATDVVLGRGRSMSEDDSSDIGEGKSDTDEEPGSHGDDNGNDGPEVTPPARRDRDNDGSQEQDEAISDNGNVGLVATQKIAGLGSLQTDSTPIVNTSGGTRRLPGTLGTPFPQYDPDISSQRSSNSVGRSENNQGVSQVPGSPAENNGPSTSIHSSRSGHVAVNGVGQPQRYQASPRRDDSSGAQVVGGQGGNRKGVTGLQQINVEVDEGMFCRVFVYIYCTFISPWLSYIIDMKFPPYL